MTVAQDGQRPTTSPTRDHLSFAEQLRALAETIDRPSEVAALLEREGWRPELWDSLEQMDKMRAEMARSLRRRAAEIESGVRSQDGPMLAELHSIIERIDRYEREEERIFVRAFWQDLGGGG